MNDEYLAGDFGALAQEAANHVLRDSVSPHVLVGPIVWEPAGASKHWYFTVASGGPCGFRCDQIGAVDKSLAERMRAALLLALAQRSPIVVHAHDDELDMARWCAAIWPCIKTAALVADIEAEQGARH